MFLVFNVAEGHERHILMLEQAHHLPGTLRGHHQPRFCKPEPKPAGLSGGPLIVDLGQELPVCTLDPV